MLFIDQHPPDMQAVTRVHTDLARCQTEFEYLLQADQLLRWFLYAKDPDMAPNGVVDLAHRLRIDGVPPGAEEHEPDDALTRTWRNKFIVLARSTYVAELPDAVATWVRARFAHLPTPHIDAIST